MVAAPPIRIAPSLLAGDVANLASAIQDVERGGIDRSTVARCDPRRRQRVGGRHRDLGPAGSALAKQVLVGILDGKPAVTIKADWCATWAPEVRWFGRLDA